MSASSPFDDSLPGRCCCCGLPTDLFEYGHWWCSICEGRGHNNPEWAHQLGDAHGRDTDCDRLLRNFIEDTAREDPTE